MRIALCLATLMIVTAGIVLADVYLADSDKDGVVDINDKCLGTTVDVPEIKLGTNRWIWNGTDWITRLPSGRGPNLQFGMVEMQGCSCQQILELYRERYGYEMEGHWKYGCSISVMEDFSENPPELVDSFCVGSNDPDGEMSNVALEYGKNYRFKVRGVWTETDVPGHYIDAEYLTYDYWSNYRDGTETGGPDQKDFQVNYRFVNWGAYNIEHTYYFDFTGTGNKVNFRVFEGNAYTDPPQQDTALYGNNRGTLSVEIYRLP